MFCLFWFCFFNIMVLFDQLNWIELQLMFFIQFVFEIIGLYLFLGFEWRICSERICLVV